MRQRLTHQRGFLQGPAPNTNPRRNSQGDRANKRSITPINLGNGNVLLRKPNHSSLGSEKNVAKWVRNKASLKSIKRPKPN